MTTGRWSEADWAGSISPEQMLAHLGGRASERKKRLFACACVRRIWPLLGDERLHAAVELAERYADGQADVRQLQRTLLLVSLLREERAAEEKRQATWTALSARAAAQAVEAILPVKGPILETPRDVRDPPDVVSATRTARTAARADRALREGRLGAAAMSSPAEPPFPLEALDAVDLLREVFGNPFRTITINPAWLASEEGTVAKRARAVYDQYRFDDLPLVADALERVGCTDADILAHCRAQRGHVRGCWVIDALLGMR
jgi:hypothetical protein